MNIIECVSVKMRGANVFSSVQIGENGRTHESLFATGLSRDPLRARSEMTVYVCDLATRQQHAAALGRQKPGMGLHADKNEGHERRRIFKGRLAYGSPVLVWTTEDQGVVRTTGFERELRENIKLLSHLCVIVYRDCWLEQ
jgi:hypothetical protein